jgi:muramoyltetrapeptide carboxypeptidase
VIAAKLQRASNIDQETLTAIVQGKRELDRLPIVAGSSFGHTTPQFTFPIGGYGSLHAGDGTTGLSIDVH